MGSGKWETEVQTSDDGVKQSLTWIYITRSHTRSGQRGQPSGIGVRGGGEEAVMRVVRRASAGLYTVTVQVSVSGGHIRRRARPKHLRLIQMFFERVPLIVGVAMAGRTARRVAASAACAHCRARRLSCGERVSCRVEHTHYLEVTQAIEFSFAGNERVEG